MGDDQAGAIPRAQERLQPLQHLEIEVVGRLVEQEQIGIGEQRLGQGDARLLAAAQLVDRVSRIALRSNPSPNSTSSVRCSMS